MQRSGVSKGRLYVDRGTYCLYEHLPFNEDIIGKIKSVVLEHIKNAGQYALPKSCIELLTADAAGDLFRFEPLHDPWLLP